MNIIDLLKFLFLGFVQGITEPIPVSSSGHLLVFQSLIKGLDGIDYGLLATLTNFGSLCAILIIFRDKIISLFKGFFGYLKNHDISIMTIISIVGMLLLRLFLLD